MRKYLILAWSFWGLGVAVLLVSCLIKADNYVAWGALLITGVALTVSGAVTVRRAVRK